MSTGAAAVASIDASEFVRPFASTAIAAFSNRDLIGDTFLDDPGWDTDLLCVPLFAGVI